MEGKEPEIDHEECVKKEKHVFICSRARLRFFLPCMLNDLSGLFARIIANFNENYHSFFSPLAFAQLSRIPRLLLLSSNVPRVLYANYDTLLPCSTFHCYRSRGLNFTFQYFSRLSFAACSTQVSSCRTCIAAQSTRRLCALDTIINFWIVCWNSFHKTDKSNFTERKYSQPNWISMLKPPHYTTTGISSNPYNSADDDDDDVIYDFVLP